MESVISLGEQLSENKKPDGKFPKKKTKNGNVFMSLRNGLVGISIVIKEERNFRIHMLAVVVVTCAGLYFKISNFEWLVLIIFFGMIMALEMINSVLEDVYDLLREETGVSYMLTGKGKDIASGAVLILSAAAVISGAIIFIPKIMHFLNL